MASSLQSFKIASIPVGEGHPPLVIPDIGTFFNQDLERAESLIRDIKEAGSRIVKGEILHSPDICLDGPTMVRYLNDEEEVVQERYRSLLERKALSLDDYARIFALCKQLEMPFILSVYDLEGAEFAAGIGASALKISSANIVHAPLIRKAASCGLPLIIDTGKNATLSEIARAVHWANDAGADRVIVQHSPPPPPAPTEDQNLRVLRTLRRMFRCPIGLSDHHAGEEMLYAATALRAAILEKGVCPDDMDGDHKVHHALPVSKLADVIKKCRTIYAALGSDHKTIKPGTLRADERMGLVTRLPVNKDSQLNIETVTFAFPTEGIPVELWDEVENWTFSTDLPKGAVIRWDCVKPA